MMRRRHRLLRSCDYDVKQRSGEKTRLFKCLYWDFLVRNQNKLRSIGRLAMPYRTLARMSEERRDDIRRDATKFLEGVEPARAGRARAEA